jgi:hypothetical protein
LTPARPSARSGQMPRKPPVRTQDKQIPVRCTTDQKERLERAAKKLVTGVRVPLGPWLLALGLAEADRVLGKEPPPPPPPAVDHDPDLVDPRTVTDGELADWIAEVDAVRKGARGGPRVKAAGQLKKLRAELARRKK